LEQIDWLDTPAPEPAPQTPATTDTADWLEVAPELPEYLKIPELDNPSDGVEVPRAGAALKDIRFEVMKGSGRVWACNGRYVACRPSGFNPATAARHNRFLRSGHYKHVGTFDDVQLFELQPGSPFYREPGDPRAGDLRSLIRAAAIAAVKRDWGAYVDLLSEIATRLKSSAPADTQGNRDLRWAEDSFNNIREYIEQLAFMRWTHDQILVEDKDYRPGMKALTYSMAFQRMKMEIDQGVQAIRAARGERVSPIVRQGPLRIRA
jgi:hypothetical protein